MKLPIIGILSGVAFASLGISGIAEAFQLIPSGLSLGNQYRLVFTTSGTRDATSTNIDDYNTFVTTQANQSSALTALGTTWTAIVSTFSTNALTNTSTDPSPSGVTGVPIYLVSGLRVADSYTDSLASISKNPITSNYDTSLHDDVNNLIQTSIAIQEKVKKDGLIDQENRKSFIESLSKIVSFRPTVDQLLSSSQIKYRIFMSKLEELENWQKGYLQNNNAKNFPTVWVLTKNQN